MKHLFRTFALTALFLATQAPAAIVTVDRVVAVVNRSAITRQELDERVSTIRQNLVKQGVTAPAADVLENEALQRMITERVLLQQAASLGIRIDDNILEQTLARMAERNKMSLPEFRQRAEAEGLNWRRLGEEIREEMTINALREREVDNRIVVTDSEIDDFLALAANKPQVEYRIAQILVALPENASPEQIQAKRARIMAARQELSEGKEFGAVAATYSNAPDAVNGGLIGWKPAGALAPAFAEMLEKLNPGQITDIVRSSSGLHLFKLLENREQSDQLVVRQSHVRHILAKTNEVVSENEARQKLIQIRDRLASGQSFAEMARLYSDDASSAKGGDLGWISPGETVPEFEQAMNQLKPGEISQPVRSQFGLHLIQVEDRRDQDMTQQSRRMKARLDLRSRKSEEQFGDWVRQLRDKAYVSLRLKEE